MGITQVSRAVSLAAMVTNRLVRIFVAADDGVVCCRYSSRTGLRTKRFYQQVGAPLLPHTIILSPTVILYQRFWPISPCEILDLNDIKLWNNGQINPQVCKETSDHSFDSTVSRVRCELNELSLVGHVTGHEGVSISNMKYAETWEHLSSQWHLVLETSQDLTP